MMFSVATMAAALLLGLALAAPTTSNTRDTRFTGTFIWYNVGTGACGLAETNSDHVVALSTSVFDPHTPDGNPNHNDLCGKKIRASYGGKRVDLKITDRCKHCVDHDIDLSKSDLEVFADDGVGELHGGTWEYI